MEKNNINKKIKDSKEYEKTISFSLGILEERADEIEKFVKIQRIQNDEKNVILLNCDKEFKGNEKLYALYLVGSARNSLSGFLGFL